MLVRVNSVDSAEKSNKTKKTERKKIMLNYEFVYKNKQKEVCGEGMNKKRREEEKKHTERIDGT